MSIRFRQEGEFPGISGPIPDASSPPGNSPAGVGGLVAAAEGKRLGVEADLGALDTH